MPRIFGARQFDANKLDARTTCREDDLTRNVCNGVGGLEKGGRRGGGLGELGSGGLGSRIVTPTPSPTPTVFQAADPYSTSHVPHQIFFASNRSRVKSSSRQVARVKFVRVKLSCTQGSLHRCIAAERKTLA